MERGEAESVPPQSPEYEIRITSAIEERAAELKGSAAALDDMLSEQVNSLEDLNTLLSSAYQRLAEQREEDRTKSFMFSYIEEIERILARVTNKQCKGISYDA